MSFPSGGYVGKYPLTDQTSQIMRNKSLKNNAVAILGVYTPPIPTPQISGNLSSNSTDSDSVDNLSPNTADSSDNSAQSGTIVVFGDSSCFDDANDRLRCNWLMKRILQVTNYGADPSVELSTKLLSEPYLDPVWNLLPPTRPADVSFSKYSRVVGKGKSLTCTAQMTQSHAYVWEDRQNLTKLEWVDKEIVPRAHTPSRTNAATKTYSNTLGVSYGYLPVYVFIYLSVGLFLIYIVIDILLVWWW